MQTDADWKTFDTATAEARQRPDRIQRMAYRAPGATSVSAQVPEPGASPEVPPREDLAAAVVALQSALAESERQGAARLQQMRGEAGEALEQAGRQAEQRGREALQAGAGQLRSALESFRSEREEYFANVEREVVKLALAIAARILNREALLDPLLLAGAVRVALGQLGETTGIRLRCPPEQVELWRELIRLLPNQTAVPDLVGEPGLAPGDCVMETRVGTVDLGVRAQLAEIESGFFDLLDRRPGAPVRRSPESAG